MNKWLELLLGLILLLAPIVVALQWKATWGAATLQFIMGGIIVVVALIGLMFIMLGISDMSS
ncbi:MAG: hypothetical protein QW041_01690 [Candidatus Pacearchaeota archaeon]